VLSPSIDRPWSASTPIPPWSGKRDEEWGDKDVMMSDALGEARGEATSGDHSAVDVPDASTPISPSSIDTSRNDTLYRGVGEEIGKEGGETQQQQGVAVEESKPANRGGDHIDEEPSDELLGPQPMPRNGPSHFHPSHRRLRHIHSISARHLSVPFTSWNAPLPYQHLLDVFFTLHQGMPLLTQYQHMYTFIDYILDRSV
jgi:hypothetical protein